MKNRVMKKKTLDKMRNWLVRETGEWTNGMMCDEDLMDFMDENYPDKLVYFKLDDECDSELPTTVTCPRANCRGTDLEMSEFGAAKPDLCKEVRISYKCNECDCEFDRIIHLT